VGCDNFSSNFLRRLSGVAEAIGGLELKWLFCSTDLRSVGGLLLSVIPILTESVDFLVIFSEAACLSFHRVVK